MGRRRCFSKALRPTPPAGAVEIAYKDIHLKDHTQGERLGAAGVPDGRPDKWFPAEKSKSVPGTSIPSKRPAKNPEIVVGRASSMEEAMKSELGTESDTRWFQSTPARAVESDLHFKRVPGQWQIELRHLRYFVAVAEELNFTRAAQRLGINQPPLSMQIRQLEEELGTRLFHRRTRGVELTDAGKLMLEEARAILGQVETAKTGVRRRARGETGQIIVGSAGAVYFHPLIPTILREYRLKYPDVILAPQASTTELLTARLRAGQIDVAFIRPPIDDSDGLAIEPLVDEEMVIVVPSGHALSKVTSAPLAALANETFVISSRAQNPGCHASIVAACLRAGFNPTFGQEAPQIVSVIPLVAAGLGVSIVPRSTSRILVDGVSYLSIEGEAPRSLIGLAYRSDDRIPAVQNFVTVARQIVRAAARRNRGGAKAA
jgi:DNA-binding transcriptional LysR family regulator